MIQCVCVYICTHTHTYTLIHFRLPEQLSTTRTHLHLHPHDKQVDNSWWSWPQLMKLTVAVGAECWRGGLWAWEATSDEGGYCLRTRGRLWNKLVWLSHAVSQSTVSAVIDLTSPSSSSGLTLASPPVEGNLSPITTLLGGVSDFSTQS